MEQHPLKQTVIDAVDQDAALLIDLSHWLHANPEIAWQEYKSAEQICQLLEEQGFAVERDYCGFPTAFKAAKGKGSLNLGVCVEYDALPGLGHACGHNIIAASSVGAGLALGRIADELDATVTLIGTPAEEGGGGKIELLKKNGFDGLHCAMMVHPGPRDVARANPYAVVHHNVKYKGKASHAAAYPDQGQNAADAFTIAQVSIGLLRQQLADHIRVHGVMTVCGEAPNAIPENTEGRWYVRANSMEELDRTVERVHNCFEAGALASGCELKIEEESEPYSDFRTDEDMLRFYIDNAESIGRVFADPADPMTRMSRASTDMGNVSYEIPSIHPYIGIDSGTAVNHQKEFAAHCITSAADQALTDAAKAMAMTCVDVATNDAVRQRLMSR
ncbi:M20 family metallopeptidase [Micrococcoides hystricis]|uniref:Peptidase M20 domain-containing protein 2 n=1 Tax=Micrococcoides hystricis TaxID=1572761 RepID=A0ABV6PB97_9MICC